MSGWSPEKGRRHEGGGGREARCCFHSRHPCSDRGLVAQTSVCVCMCVCYCTCYTLSSKYTHSTSKVKTILGTEDILAGPHRIKGPFVG